MIGLVRKAGSQVIGGMPGQIESQWLHARTRSYQMVMELRAQCIRIYNISLVFMVRYRNNLLVFACGAHNPSCNVCFFRPEFER